MAPSSDVPRPPEDENAILRRYVRALARHERLMEINRSLNATLDLNALLEQIVRAAADLTATEAASILLMSQAGTLRFEAAIAPEGLLLGSVDVPLEGSVAGWVVTHGEPLLIADASQELRWWVHVDEKTSFHTRNLLAVPMRTHDRIIGCLEAINKVGDQAFTDEDVSTLTTLSAQAAVAVENAYLFEQSDLIAEMVHELRTPLAAIRATTNIMLHPQLSEEKRADLVDLIAQETTRLTRMTTEFLDLARLESGRTQLERKPVDLGLLLEEAAQTVGPQAADRGITLSLDLAALPDSLSVVGDAEKLRQVVLNLLTNGIKYNQEGGSVWLRGRVDGRQARVEVEDTGLGIAAEYLDHMFEKFFRVADSEGYTQGSGLGLAIARRIVEGHGGQIGVESEAGRGALFWFTLPLPTDAGSSPGSESEG